MNTAFPVVVIKASVITAALSAMLSGCGGGGGGSAGGFQLPFSCNNVASSFAGCWASELCATNSGVPGARLVEVVEQTGSTPNLNGNVSSYLVEYDNAQCTGSPVSVIDLNATGNFTESYEEQGFTTCTDFDTSDPVSCVNLDITVTANAVVTTGYTAYAITDTDNRLCLSFGDYNFDNTGNGGMGLPTETDPLNRPSNIDQATDNCMTRIYF